MSSEAHVKPTSRLSKVWFIPIVAVIIGLWMVWYQWQNQGPLITIELKSASGIEVNKTPIKVRDLEVGQVKKIELTPDLNGVKVTARIDASAEQLLTENTNFWVVAPRISFSEVSGLNTLLSGSYIAMSADDSGREQLHFVALERPPVTPPGTPGLHLRLKSNDKFAYKAGDPIIYKGFKVGEFEDAEFNIDDRLVYYSAFIEAPYHRLITNNTRFWNVSGVTLNINSGGVMVETGSLETLLANGVTFGIPSGSVASDQAQENTTFMIYADDAAASNARFKLSAEYLLLIDETVRGLTEGAPVEYRGLEIGEVVTVNATEVVQGNVLDENYPIPVLIRIYPGKVRQQDNQAGLEYVRNVMKRWIGKDLRATLRMGNLITGGLFVDLQHANDVAPKPVRDINGIEVIPTVSNEFTQLTQKADAILDKINALPLNSMMTDIRDVVVDLKAAANSVDRASSNFDELLGDVDGKALNTNLNRALKDLSTLLRNYSQGGLSQSEIKDTVDTMQETLRNLQPLLLQLNQNPSRLIFSGDNQKDIQPKAHQRGDSHD